MTQADPLNTSPWKPVDLDWGDGETVRVIDHDAEDTPHMVVPDESVPARAPEQARSPVSVRGPARLIAHPRHTDNHTERVTGLINALKLANEQLTLPNIGARDWASDLRYGDLIIERVNEASVAIHEALDLIDIHENG